MFHFSLSRSLSCFCAPISFISGAIFGAILTSFLKTGKFNRHPSLPEPNRELKDVKMKFLVRGDLSMGRGKIAAQCGHGTQGVINQIMKEETRRPEWLTWFSTWNSNQSAKIALKVESRDQLVKLTEKAKANGVPFYQVYDAGHTQVAPNTFTVCAVGPAPSHLLKFTDNLKLL